MIKRYSFPTKETATDLIELLSDEPNPTVTETTSGIRLLGFQDVYEDEVLVKEGTTYDVDVFWKNEPNENWIDYEVTPKSPNHNFA